MMNITATTTTSSTREKPCSRRFSFFMGSSLSQTFPGQRVASSPAGTPAPPKHGAVLQETPLFVREQLDSGTGSEQCAGARPQVPVEQLQRFPDQSPFFSSGHGFHTPARH